MAFRWRIRHKLLCGFGLTIAIIGLLLAGTFYGLWSYRLTRRTIDSKLEELKRVGSLRDQIKQISEPNAKFGNEYDVLKNSLGQARQALRSYEANLAESLSMHRGAEDGHYEMEMVKVIGGRLNLLESRLDELSKKGMVVDGGTRFYVDESQVKEQLSKLKLDAQDLKGAIFSNLDKQTDQARQVFWNVLYWVIGISIIGILLMAGTFQRFYRWIVHPIRDLQLGVERIAQGDFEHAIEVNSGDEMESLAARFNYMTSQLNDLYTDLERQVNERSRQLVRSEHLASVGFLAAGVAHEINNPLASIAFCSEALDNRLQDLLKESGPERDSPAPDTLPFSRAPMTGQDRETIAKYLKMIQDESFRCKEITQRLLEFSRGGEGHRERVNLNELIQSVLDVVQHLENGRGKDVIFQPTGMPVAWINGQEIKSVVLNLVVNALESMEEGGVLTITHRDAGGMAEITFADTGCGMTADVLENIFEPFFTRSRTGKGTGLGLSISHRIINQHGGEIEAFSPGPNRGSTFVVRLPLKPAKTDAEKPDGESAIGDAPQLPPRRAA